MDTKSASANSSNFVAIGSTVAIGFLIIFVVLLWKKFSQNGQRNKSNDKTSQKNVEPKSDGSKTEAKKSKKKTYEKRKEKSTFSHPWLQTTIKGHTDTIKDLDISSNGKYIASCDEDFQENTTSPRTETSIVSSDTTSPVNGKWLPRNCTVAKNRIFHNNNKIINSTNRVAWIFQKLNMSESDLYQYLKRYTLTEQDFALYGYPIRIDYDKALVYSSDIYQEVSTQRISENGNCVRKCCRCKAEYLVKSSGEVLSNEVCVYHWGKLQRQGPGLFSCCQGDRFSKGCTTFKSHVSTGITDGLLEGYVYTRRRRSIPSDGNFGIYAVDCEMCYTTQGLELAKVTLVKPDGKIAYDAMVKPSNPIIDYNTRFSGITAKDLRNVSKTLTDVQYDLRKMITEETILIGHGLECDLKALRLVHYTVVDTSVVFPHFWGPPYRLSLKSLVSSYLQKEIQESENGHCSIEDAHSSLELMLWRVRQDMVYVVQVCL